MGYTDGGGGDGDFVGERSFFEGDLREDSVDPFFGIVVQFEAILLAEDEDFPGADGRDPEFVVGVGERLSGALGKVRGFQDAPDPNVRIEEEFQSLSALQSLGEVAGPTMSPTMVPVPAKEPSQCLGRSANGGGTIWATGSPNFVMMIGLRVLRTSSTTERQVAFNLETAIWLMI